MEDWLVIMVVDRLKTGIVLINKSLLRNVANQRYVVALQHQAAQGSAAPALAVNLDGVVQHCVHEFVEALQSEW